MIMMLIIASPLPCVVTGSEILVSTKEELKTAVASAKPDDTLVVQDGTYTGWRIALRTSGTATAPVTLRAQTSGGVRFTGEVRVEITGQYLVVSGFLFEDALSSRHNSIVEFRNAQHCRLTGCAKRRVSLLHWEVKAKTQSHLGFAMRTSRIVASNRFLGSSFHWFFR
jgi:poly(beta-D-mannuronate) lyase